MQGDPLTLRSQLYYFNGHVDPKIEELANGNLGLSLRGLKTPRYFSNMRESRRPEPLKQAHFDFSELYTVTAKIIFADIGSDHSK